LRISDVDPVEGKAFGLILCLESLASGLSGHVDVIEFLFKNNADINKQTEEHSMSSLHIAIYNKHLHACKIILEYKPNQNIESGITMSWIAKAPEIQVLL
jgi:ankyrin repeat protein